MKRNLAAMIATGACALGLAACSGSSSDSTDSSGSAGTGTLTLGLIDAPVYDIARICILITDINIKPADGQALNFGVEGLTGTPECDRDGNQVDLLSLRDPGDPAVLLDAVELDVGNYEWIELVLDASVMGRAAAGNSYVIMNDGTEHTLRVPSGSLRLVSGFTITAGQHTRFTLDWDARAGMSGVVNPPGLDGVLLRPAFRIIDMTDAVTLSGQVSNTFISADSACGADDSGDLDVGNVVYIYEGAGVDPYPDAGDAPAPLATVDVENDAGDYVYETLLSPGDYTVLFTCQGDLEDTELVFEQPDEGADLTVADDGADVQRNFLTLTPS